MQPAYFVDDEVYMSPEPTPRVSFIPTSDDVSQAMRDLYASGMLEAISGFTLANAMFAFIESKLFDDMNDGVVRLPESIERYGYVAEHALGLMRYLVTQGYFSEANDQIFHSTPRGHAAFRLGSRGFLQLYRGGYGHLMANANKLIDGSWRYGTDTTRDGRYVALGSSNATSMIYDSVPLQVIERRKAKTVADLGCGACKFLIRWVSADPSHRGIGVDLDPHAIAESREKIAAAGVADRVKLVIGDGYDLSLLAKECTDAELFCSFGMEHELLRDGEEAVLSHIDRMAALFPGRRYLMGEPMLHQNRDDGAFYWLHTLSRQGIPRNVATWSALLARLKKAQLAEVFVPEHRLFSAYFDISF
jgi:SAM-dependent methyltransferase